MSAAMVALLACLVPVRAGEAPEPDILWSSYARGTAPRRALLEESVRRVGRIRTDAESGAAWQTGEDVRWLLGHRLVAVLVVEQELEKGPSGTYAGALATLALRLGHRRLLQRLPGLLKAARTDADRLQALRVLSDLRTPEAIRALQGYLQAEHAAPVEALICEAARGLGLGRDPAHLPVLEAAGRLVTSPAGRTQLAMARYRCGDPAACAELVAATGDESLDMDLRAAVPGVLAERPSPQVLTDLAAMAVSDRPQIADAAFQALLEALVPSDAQAPASQDPPEPAEAGEDVPGGDGPWHEVTAEEKARIVGELLRGEEELRSRRSREAAEAQEGGVGEAMPR
ncbi:MAG: hypothetical protein GXY85_06520 [Candidatus Brocadiaceae bacterium]|nr:hypothetical protein [Candidatus Brocadiaceae bacterium]